MFIGFALNFADSAKKIQLIRAGPDGQFSGRPLRGAAPSELFILLQDCQVRDV